jgi:TolB-like protein
MEINLFVNAEATIDPANSQGETSSDETTADESKPAVKQTVNLGKVKETKPTTNGVYSIKIPLKAMQDLASKLCSKVAADTKEDKQKAVAVLDFELIAKSESLRLDKVVGRNVREDLSTAMGESQDIRVVERGQITSALKNLKMEQSGLVDAKNAKKLGKMVSADFVLVGSVSDRGDCVVINARMIYTETGQVKYSTSTELAKN